MQRISIGILFITTLFLLSLGGSVNQANAQGYTGVSFSLNVPDQPIGFDIRGVKTQDVSFFGQVKSSPWPPETETYENISQDTFNDRQVDSKTVLVSLSAGLTYGITRNFHLWGGVGMTSESKYAELNDPTDILGSRDGRYWVKSEGETLKPKVLGGVGTTFGSKHWYGLLGGEYNPTGVNVTFGFRW